MNIQINRVCVIEQIEEIEKTLEHRILSSNILNDTLKKDNYYYFVATIENVPVGYIAAEYLVDHFDLLSIAVLEKHRRKNIATLLLNELFSICSSLNVHDIFLEVRLSNLSAINFYERVGFEKISCRKNYYTDTNEDALIYLKKV